jgi:tetratricopeptide (TPR) repeat protein|nr:hypothetical protein [uncultured Dongia sp.]
MVEKSGPSAWDLEREARNLRHLLQDYVEDREIVARGGCLLNFVDAHEIKAFINPDNGKYLAGFIMDAEQVYLTDNPSARLEMRFRNEHFLRKLLFLGPGQVGLLPSHGEEVDEEIAFRSADWIHETIKLLDAARDQRKVHGERFRRLLATADASRQDPSVTRAVLEIFHQLAPALMVLARQNLDSPIARIDALTGQDSKLVLLEQVAWDRLGFTAEANARLKAVRLNEDLVDRWRDYFAGRSDRHGNSPRANRIDAEAVAYLYALNSEIREIGGPNVRVRLVTRAKTLLRATRDRRSSDASQPPPGVGSVRHPRLVVTNQDEDRAYDASTEQSFIVALHTYQRQISAARSSDPSTEVSLPIEALRTLVRARHEFERAHFAVDVRAQAYQVADADDRALLTRLLELFSSESDVIHLLNAEFRESINAFESATYNLGTTSDADPILGTRSIFGHPGRTRVLPMKSGAPGPVEFLNPELLKVKEPYIDLDKLIEKFEGELAEHYLPSSAERYIAWALVLACRGRWNVAGIYARSAIDVAKLLPEEEGHQVGREARLLRAQIRRLGGFDSREPDLEANGPLNRYKDAMRELSEAWRKPDARILREQAAQILEYQLIAHDGDDTQIADGISYLQQALQLTERDEVLRTRVLELVLCYHLAADIHQGFWVSRSIDDRQIGFNAHADLHRLLTAQRDMRSLDEISRRARAVELIGFQMFADIRHLPDELKDLSGDEAIKTKRAHLQIPQDLRYEFVDIVTQLRKGSDYTSVLLVTQLELLAARVMQAGTIDLTYAPISTPEAVAATIAKIPHDEAKSLIEFAYRKLERAAMQASMQSMTKEWAADLHEVINALSRAESLLDPDFKAGSGKEIVFQIRIERCFAQLLISKMQPSPKRQAALKNLREEYRSIAEEFPGTSIPYFRLNIVCSELGEETAAVDAIVRALELLEADPYLHDRSHWVRRTIRRRFALRFGQEAKRTREQMRKDPSKRELLQEGYLKAALKAFDSVYVDVGANADARSDTLGTVEVLRTINNIVYYASFIIEVEQGWAELEAKSFSKDEMGAFLRCLHPDGIDKVDAVSIVHTIGFAYSALDDHGNASKAGKRLLRLLQDGDDFVEADEVELIADALSWIRAERSQAARKLEAVGSGYQ